MLDGTMKELPHDVMIYILVMLPVKSLLRFKCSCKTFCNIIKSATFINLHLNHTTNFKDELVLLKRSFKTDEYNFYKSILSFLSSKEDYDFTPISPDVEIPHLTTTSACVFHQLIGPCNGLIALTDSLTTILFNPTTRYYRLIPPCPFGIPRGFRRSISGFGFGFDSNANDYKVVRISEVYKYHYDKDMKVDIYDVSVDSWRELNLLGQKLPIVLWFPCSEILYKRNVHWFAVADDVVILCFDFSTELFKNIEMPNAHDIDGMSYGLVILYKFLTLICYHYPMFTEPTEDLVDIWIMKEYGQKESWIKRFSVNLLPIESPLAVWKDELLLLQTRSGQLFTYDLNSDEVKELNLHGCPESLRVVVYKESLTLIPRNDGGAEVQPF
uniref:S19-locus linked F-box protein 2 n=1 Tax=Petunia axillaris subsp. axillaris TaxID=55889 RepID=A0A140JNP9_PETAX|nr:S19-locus linked F-box protein 2 [Petunia axillaris subsp. axillaris]